MFIGDSISVNHFESFLCLLHAAAPNSDIIKHNNGSVSSVIFKVSRDFYFKLSLVLTFSLKRILLVRMLFQPVLWKRKRNGEINKLGN